MYNTRWEDETMPHFVRTSLTRRRLLAGAAATTTLFAAPSIVRAQDPHTSFNVGGDGFKFANSFDNYRFFGPIQTNFSGRCGGMSYSSLDYYLNHLPIPPQSNLPAEGSALSTYISGRQERSILSQIDKWAELFVNPLGARNAEFFNWGIQESGGGQLGLLTREIDAGRPVVLGLFNADDQLTHHQVVAVGYEKTSGASPVSIFLYDPNHPGTEKVLIPHPSELLYYYPDRDPTSDQRWRTYFVDLNYRAQMPPSNEELAGCSGTDLSNRDMHGLNLSNGNYRCANCINTNFTGCTINQADFELANLEGANFYGANLRNSNFSNARLVSANFYGADLKDTQFLHSNIGRGSFHGADLKLANLSDALLTTCDFVGADLAAATLNGAICDSANFYGAHLATGNLVGTRFRGATFVGADLRNADARNADFTFANMTGADLRGAKLCGAIGLRLPPGSGCPA
jgi:uncharacterized protein YjbI with pentapeptide repeats